MCAWFSNFLEKALVKPRESADVHPHGEVCALDVGSRDVRRVWLAFDLRLLDASAFGRW